MSFSQSFKDRGLISSSLRPGISPKKQQQPTKQKVFNMHGKITGIPHFKDFKDMYEFGTFVVGQLARNSQFKEASFSQWLEEICQQAKLDKKTQQLKEKTMSFCLKENCHELLGAIQCFDALLALKKAVDNQKVKLPVISDKISNDKKLSDKKKNDKEISLYKEIANKISPNKKKYKLKWNKNNSMLNMAPIKHEQEEVDGTKQNAYQVKHGSYFNVNEEDIRQEIQQGDKKKSKSEPKQKRDAFGLKPDGLGGFSTNSNNVKELMKQTTAFFSASDQQKFEQYNRRNVEQKSHNKFNNWFKNDTFGSYLINDEDKSSVYLYNGNCRAKRNGQNLFRPQHYHSDQKDKKFKIKKNGKSTLNIKSTLPLLKVYQGFHQ